MKIARTTQLVSRKNIFQIENYTIDLIAYFCNKISVNDKDISV